MDLLLGIDVGTTGCKASLFDTEGRLISSGYREYKIISTRIGWAEENPEEWWRKVSEAIRESIDKQKIKAKNIAGVAISCTNGLVAVDKEGKPLINAIMQIDNRCHQEVSWIKDTIGEDTVFAITGNRIAAGTFSAPNILWIKNNLQEVFKNTSKFLVPTGFIVYKLTGEFCIDYTRASTTLLFDIRSKQWSGDLCSKMKIPMDKLPEHYPSDVIAGKVTKEAAELTGLVEGTPVAVGLMDTAAAAIGMGAIDAYDPFLIIGTVSRLSIGLKESRFDRRFLNACYTSETPWMAMAPTNGGGISLKWFRDTFGEMESLTADNMGVSPYQLFNVKASRINAGSDGLIYLPYIAGERSPIWDSYAKGVFFGISPSHRKAHFIKAIMEGVAYATKHNLEILEKELGIQVDNIKIGGGGALSSLWREIMAQVLGKTILKPKIVETETLGSAFIAGKAVEVFNTYNEVKRIIQIESESKPKEEFTNLYNKYFQLYKMLYTHLKDDYQYLQSIL
ncbi:MAG: xylulokinase [Clostridiales bacterium]|jgi:xylulokinase|nr:xylulokinase [Clostridiales bacterium]